MLNFTVGPVMQYERSLKIASQNSPYFRTEEFSRINLESESLLISLLNASNDYKCVLLTGSGSFGMETACVNILKSHDKVLVINGGSFGQRFANIMSLHNIPFTEIKLEFGKTLTEEELYAYDNQGYTALCVNMDETSSGTLYDLDLISRFCKQNDIILIVDAISSFIADEIYTSNWGIDCVITASQKAIAIQPGLSTLTLSPRAVERIYTDEGNVNNSLYMDLRYALENQKRGQPSYTPCVNIFLQLNDRLKMLNEIVDGRKAIDIERDHIKKLAKEFREYVIKSTPYTFVSNHSSNCVTGLYTPYGNAKEIFNTLIEKYQIWICPNGGKIADTTFRVGHIGNITDENNKTLIQAFMEITK